MRTPTTLHYSSIIAAVTLLGLLPAQRAVHVVRAPGWTPRPPTPADAGWAAWEPPSRSTAGRTNRRRARI